MKTFFFVIGLVATLALVITFLTYLYYCFLIKHDNAACDPYQDPDRNDIIHHE